MYKPVGGWSPDPSLCAYVPMCLCVYVLLVQCDWYSVPMCLCAYVPSGHCVNVSLCHCDYGTKCLVAQCLCDTVLLHYVLL